MSHRPEDHYEYVATEDISFGFVTAFKKGDPVPADTVEAHGFLDAGVVVHRSEYEPDTGEEAPAVAMVRGEMPPHLQKKAASDADPEPKKTTTAKKVPAGKASE